MVSSHTTPSYDKAFQALLPENEKISIFLDLGYLLCGIYPLEYKALVPYIENEPILNQRFKKMKRKKDRELIVVLKAYNELYPIQFPVY